MDEQYVDLICTRMLPLVQKWKRTSRYSTLVRYEDLPGQCPDVGKAVTAGHPTGAITTPRATKVVTTVQVGVAPLRKGPECYQPVCPRQHS
jgi:hypothetical protein